MPFDVNTADGKREMGWFYLSILKNFQRISQRYRIKNGLDIVVTIVSLVNNVKAEIDFTIGENYHW